jgi:DNA replication ATP-dependent helicase Dna2
MPSAPLSVSSQSRNKLRTFAPETKPIDDVREGNKANSNDAALISGPVVGSQDFHDEDLQKSSPQLPQLPSEKQCPQTPANRIPLADLIGNTEDAFNCDQKDTTPEDHIYWQHGPTPRSSVPSAADNSARRGKKRARSSSPASSSQNQKSTHFNVQETLDLKTLHESLKTPHNDPALDLWARYTDASLAKKDADGKPLPAFAHLMTSSPQTPNTTNGKDSGLRRSISCGIEWPASKAKRRKVNQELVEGRVKDVFAASKTDIMASGKSKASRITLLMEKLQENSRKVPQIEVSGPSSSSPLPDRIALPNPLVISPAPKRRARKQENDEVMTTEEDHLPMGHIPAREDNDSDGLSSEFGDDELALDLLEAVEQSECAQVGLPNAGKQGFQNLPLINDGPHKTHAERVDQFEDQLSPHKPGAELVLPPVGNHIREDSRTLTDVMPAIFAGDDDDEFEDGSDDNGVMADLAARFDTQRTTSSPPPHPHTKQLHQDEACNSRPTPAQAANDYDDDNTYDDDGDDDLWNQIGDGSLVLQQDNDVATANQVRVIL